jgi:hypothetical protein
VPNRERDERDRDRDYDRRDDRGRGRYERDDRRDDRGGRGRGGGFVFERNRSYEDAKKEIESSGRRFDAPVKSDVQIFRAKEGDSYIRILPPTWPNPKHWAYEADVHNYVGNGAYMCLGERKCPICKASKEAKAAGSEDEGKKLAPKNYFFAYVIDRNDDKSPPVPKIYMMSWSIHRDLRSQATDHRSKKIVYIDDPDEGYDVTIKRVGKTKETTKYTFIVDREKSPLHDDPRVQQDILDYVADHPIPDMLLVHHPDYLTDAIEGTVEEHDPDLDDPTEDRRGRGARDDRGDDRGARDRRDAPPAERTRITRESLSNDQDEEERDSSRDDRRATRDDPRDGARDRARERDFEPDARSARAYSRRDPPDDPQDDRRDGRRDDPRERDRRDDPAEDRRGSRYADQAPVDDEPEYDPPSPRSSRSGGRERLERR